jgi:hypothetical protein
MRECRLDEQLDPNFFRVVQFDRPLAVIHWVTDHPSRKLLTDFLTAFFEERVEVVGPYTEIV